MKKNRETQEFPIVPLKGSVLFPHLLMPIAVGRPRSRAAIEAALSSEDQKILLVTQKDGDVEVPSADDLHTIGTVATIKRVARPSDGVTQLLVQGEARAVLVKVEQCEPHGSAP